jgi:methyl-accepting chemotaxis protein
MAMTMMAAVLWQDSLGTGNTRLLMIFVGLAAVALFVQACVMIAMAVIAAKAKTNLVDQLEEIKAKVFPLVEKSQQLVVDLAPKLNNVASNATTISTNVVDISCLVREKLHEFGPTLSAANETLASANQTAREANQKTREQVDRVNGMVTSVLDATAEAGKTIQRGINVPVREAAGIFGALKVGFFTFLNGAPKPKPPVYRAPVGTYQGTGDTDQGSGMQAD